MKENTGLQTRKASIKETGEELTQEEWARFDAAVAEVKAERLEHSDGSNFRLPEELDDRLPIETHILL